MEMQKNIVRDLHTILKYRAILEVFQLNSMLKVADLCVTITLSAKSLTSGQLRAISIEVLLVHEF